MKKLIIWFCEKLGIVGYICKIIVKEGDHAIVNLTFKELLGDTDWHRRGISYWYKYTGEKKVEGFTDGLATDILVD